MADDPQSTLFRQILDLPVVEEIVDRWIEILFRRGPRLREIVVDVRLIDGAYRRIHIRIRGQQHTARERIHVERLREQFITQHSRHPLIADDHRQCFAARLQFPNGRERLLSGFRAEDGVVLPISRTKIPAHRCAHLRIVVDEQQRGFVHEVTPAALSTVGSSTRNSVRPGRELTAISPSL